MDRYETKYKVVIKNRRGRAIHVAYRDPDRPLPFVAWSEIPEWADYFTHDEAWEIARRYSDQKPSLEKVVINYDPAEEPEPTS